jgi:hypothetical protein
LSEWVAAGNRSVAWLSLDKGDNDLVSLMTYLVAALQTINAGIGVASDPVDKRSVGGAYGWQPQGRRQGLPLRAGTR